MTLLRMADLDLAGKRVLIREDLNVPVRDGHITSEQRITAALPTLRLALEKGAAVMVTSHLGRPTGASESSCVARCRCSGTGPTACRCSPASWCCWRTAA